MPPVDAHQAETVQRRADGACGIDSAGWGVAVGWMSFIVWMYVVDVYIYVCVCVID